LASFSPELYGFSPIAFRCGSLVGLFTDPFVAPYFSLLILGVAGLFLIGVPLEVSLSRKMFVLTILTVVEAYHLIFLILSFLVDVGIL
jgi:hypothetical protein